MKSNLKKVRSLLLLLGLLSPGIKAQLTGVFSVPGTYTSIAAAISDLNTLGVSGPVTINIAAGYTETAPAGGFILNAIANVSAINQVTFQKSGVGANPVVSAYTGTAIPSSAMQDGVWIFSGSDYVTVDGIDITDANTTNPATMEFGYGFFRAGVSDGCQNNTIKNCVITLNRVNNAAGAGPATDGSRGIDVVNATYSAHTTALVISAAAGANANNKFYSNTIQNCNIGIALIGYAAPSPFTLADNGNDVGGAAAGTGNTIINFGGGGATSAAAGVRTLAQYGINVSYNQINSNNGGGVLHTQVLRGIYLNTAVSANATVNNNTITVKGGGTTNQVTAIENVSGATAASNTIAINNNLVTNCTYTTATSGVFYGIYNNGATAAVLSISGNTLSTNSSNATSGSYFSIYNTAAVTGSILINNNRIDGTSFNAASTSLAHRVIYNTGAGSASSLMINLNSIQNVTFVGAGSGAVDMIYNSGTALQQIISGNILVNLSINTTGSMYLFYCSNTMPATGLRSITGNSVITGFSKTLAGGTVYGYYSFATSPPNGTEFNTNNNISNINVTGATAVTLWQSADGPASTPFGPAKIITNNTFTNVVAGTSAVIGIYSGYSNVNAPGTVSNNIVSVISCSCAITGIYLNNGNHTVNDNAVSSFSSAGSSSAVMGINLNAGTTHNLYRNKIYDLQNNQAGGSVTGLNVVAGTTNLVYNNLIGDLRLPAANAANALIGISLSGGTTNNLYYNTVYLNAASSSGLFGSSAISVNATPATIDLRNNIFVNTSAAAGSGLTVAYRRSTAVLTNYAATSNNNLFYAGTPSASNLIFADGTNVLQTLGTFQALMATRDGLSVTENPPFQSVVGSSATFLHINPTMPSLTESGAVNVAGITDDYDVQIRQGNPGYAGSGSAPDIGADEYNQSLPPCSTVTTPTISPVSFTICAGQSVSMNASGLTPAGSIVNQWRSASTSGGPYTNVAGGTGANAAAYTSAALTAGTYYYVFVSTCGVTSNSATSNQATVTVNAVPAATASALVQNICAGQDINLTGNTNIGVVFAWTGPNAFSSAAQNPTITNAGLTASGIYTLLVSSNNCTAAPASVTVAVNVAPSALTLTALSSTICSGSSQTVGATGGSASATLNFGSQTNQNTASTGAAGYPAPYTMYYGGQRMQMLILASELSNAGFSAGVPFTDIQFPVVSKAANWGVTTTENQNFQVNIGATALTSLSAFQAGLTNVVPAGNFTPVVGYGNTHTFSAPYVWNGTSNIIIETTWSNNYAGTAADLVVQYNSPTSFQSTIVYRADSQTAAAIATNNGISFSYSVRPDFRLNGMGVGVFSWSPATGLSATNTPTVSAAPVTSTNYTVSSALGTCSSSAVYSLSVIPGPILNVNSSAPSVCAGSGSVSLNASGANSYTWTGNGSLPSISVSPSVTTTYTVSGQNQNCPVVTATIEIIANPVPTLIATSSSSAVCLGDTAILNVNGANSYTWSTADFTSTISVVPAASTVYSVVGSNTLGCVSMATVAVVSNSLPVILITPANPSVCLNSVASLTVAGAGTYSWNNGSTSSNFTVIPAASTPYTVTGTDASGCSSSQVVMINVNALPTVMISPPSATICASEIVTFVTTGANTYTWLPANLVSNSFTASPTASEIYTVVGMDANSCKNSASVSVIVDACTGIAARGFADNAVRVFPNPSSGWVTAAFGFEGTKTVLITNSVGQIILQAVTEQASESFDLSGMAKGIYFIRVSTLQASGNYKLVIE